MQNGHYPVGQWPWRTSVLTVRVYPQRASGLTRPVSAGKGEPAPRDGVHARDCTESRDGGQIRRDRARLPISLLSNATSGSTAVARSRGDPRREQRHEDERCAGEREARGVERRNPEHERPHQARASHRDDGARDDAGRARASGLAEAPACRTSPRRAPSAMPDADLARSLDDEVSHDARGSRRRPASGPAARSRRPEPC